MTANGNSEDDMAFGLSGGRGPVQIPGERSGVTSDRIHIPEEFKEGHSSRVPVTLEGPSSRVPVDRGWAWAVLLGATLEMFVVIGIMKCTGILFVELQQKFESGSAMTSLISTVQMATYSISAVLVMTLGMKVMTCRTAIMIGSFVTCSAYVITSVVQNIDVAMISLGLLQGLGIAFIEPGVLVTLGRYFEKRRGLANSVAVSGGSLGGLVMAPLLTSLFQYYGFPGAFLLTGAFYLNICVVGALLRPVQFYMTQSARNERNRDQVEMTLEKGEVNDYNAVAKASASEQRQMLMRGHGPEEGVRLQAAKDMGSARVLGDMLTATSVSSLALNGYSSHCKEGSAKPRRSFSGLKAVANLFAVELFKDPLFLLYMSGSGLICPPGALFGMYLAPHAKEIGVGLSDAALLMSIIAAIDLVARILVGVLADKRFVRPSTLVGLSTIVLGILGHFLRFFQGFAGLVIFAVIIGLIGGVYFALFAVVMVDYMTLEKMESCMGFLTLFNGVAMSISFIVVGAIRDSTGDYLAPYHFLGLQAILGGVLMLSLGPVQTRLQRRASK